MSDRSAPRWRTTTWRGHTNYECRRCPFKTLDRGLMVRHARMAHPRAWEDAPAAEAQANPMAGVNFASDDAAEFASKQPRETIEHLKRQTPSGKRGGYTMADVRTAAAAVTSEPKEG